MSDEIRDIERRQAEFDAEHSPEGLLKRYAAGRVRHFPGRQLVTLSGALTLGLLVSVEIGLIALFTALIGEVLDVLLLRRVPAMFARGASFARVQWLTTISAMFQALTIAACAVLAWVTSENHASTFFCMAYLTGAAVNGGIVLPFHRHAAIGKLLVYGLTCPILFAIHLFEDHSVNKDFFYNLLAAMMMAYMVGAFISFAVSGRRRHFRNSRNLLAQSLQIAKAHASLNEQQDRLRQLALVAERATDSVLVSDTEGTIIWVNDSFTRITGYTAEEAIGQQPGDLLNGPDTDLGVSDDIARAITEQRPYRAEIINYTKDGRRIWIETNLTPVFNDAGEVDMVIAIERDITEAKAYEDEMAAAKRAAEQAEQAKSDFLANMSHEIRTPMNGIVGMADLLSEAGLSQDNQLYVDTIRQSADALLTIINDVLDFSKLNAGKLSMHPVPFRLHDCMIGIIRLLEPQARQKGLSLDYTPDGTLPEFVIGDEGRFRQILVNIIGNAVKFTETGGVSVVLAATEIAGQQHLNIRVTDTGVGIAQDQLEHIFEQFAQSESAATRKYGGTGLGLAISKLLIEKMQGSIRVTSTQGKGSCFTITLRMGTADKATRIPQSTSLPAPEQFAGLTVLLAEDNQTNRLVIRKLLKDYPISLITAHDGRQAVDKTKAYLPDVVLMDMSMPEIDGLQATREIRALSIPQPRIIALTANAFDTDREACLSAGMDDFLSKPVRKAKLLTRLLPETDTDTPSDATD